MTEIKTSAPRTLAEIQAGLDRACEERIAIAMPFLQQYGVEIQDALSKPTEDLVRIRIRGPPPPYLHPDVFKEFRAALMFVHPAFREVIFHSRSHQNVLPVEVIIIFVGPIEPSAARYPPASFLGLPRKQ